MLQNNFMDYTYEWLAGGIFSLNLKTKEDKKICCNYHPDTGIFDFYYKDMPATSLISIITPAEKEQMKFLVIQALEEFLYDETMFLTTMEPFSK